MAVKFVGQLVVATLLLASLRSAVRAQVPLTAGAVSDFDVDPAEQLPQAASDAIEDSSSKKAAAISDSADETGFCGDANDVYAPSCGDACSPVSDCCLGSAWTLHDTIAPCSSHSFGGWIAAGYYSDETGLSFFAPLNDFNDYPDHLNLDQAWLYVEKIAQGGCCSADWGYRADVVYGVQAQKTQAFGNNNGTWDNSFDNGAYGWAIPQAYGDLLTAIGA